MNVHREHAVVFGLHTLGRMQPSFSARTDWNLETTRYARALSSMRAGGVPFVDLTTSNPTACGFEYDNAGILRALSQPQCLLYEPDPRGLRSAREAVAQYYADAAGVHVDPDRIFLTASTSEAYSHLFRLHCDAGAEVLVAEPSYPLFEFLAGIDDVCLVAYPLLYECGWQLDRAALESRITPRTRALVVVHPNNPTGHGTSPDARKTLEQICGERGLALIVDEVFLDYLIQQGPSTPGRSDSQLLSFACGPHPVSTYVLSGLSKIAALPQMKVAWIAVFGPDEAVQQATARLEVIADTFLSVNAPAQHALPFLLRGRGAIQSQIRARVRQNLAELDRQLPDLPAIARLEAQAGWNVVLRVPALRSADELAVHLLEKQHVAIHPGYFYGFEGDGWIVLSLLPPPAEFAQGMARLLDFFR